MSDPNGLSTFFQFVDDYARKDIISTAAKVAPNEKALAELVYNLRRAKDVLLDAIQYVEDELIKAMPEKAMLVDGIGEVEYHTGAQRKAWDHDELRPLVAHAIATSLPNMVDTESGEVVDPIMLTNSVLTEFAAAASPNWKVTGLRPLGIDPSDFCETSWGRKTVEMPKPEAFIPMPNLEEAMQ